MPDNPNQTHADYLVDLLDTDGAVVGTVPRGALDKERHNYHVGHLRLLGEGRVNEPTGNVVQRSVYRLDSDTVSYDWVKVGAMVAPPLDELRWMVARHPERFTPAAIDIWLWYGLLKPVAAYAEPNPASTATEQT